MSNKLLKTTATIAAAAAAVVAIVFLCIYYYHHDPAEGGAPQCTFKLLTGYDCPGCGSQRALHAFLHGRFSDAWGFNPLVFFALPTAAFYLWAELNRRRRPRLYAAAVNPLLLTAILTGIIIFWIVRNL